MFDPDFLEMMNTSVLHRAVASRDAYGKTIWATAIAMPRCKVTRMTRVLRQANREEATTSFVIHIPPPGFSADGVTMPTIAMTDEVSVDGTLYLPVLAVDVPDDEDGTPHHQKITI